VRSVQPLSPSPADELTFARTSVMVTNTCANGPVGPLQVAGSLSITLAAAMAGRAGAEDPPLLHAAIDMPASTNPEIAKIAQRDAPCFVLPCVADMRLLPEVSPQARAENETESTATGNQVGLTTLGRS
jgi:hypothetical protein